MKQKTTLTRSRWLFACLLSLLMTLGGASPAWAQKSLPYNYDFSVALNTEGWTKENCHSSTGISSGAFRFYYNTNPPQYLISPELATISSTVDVSFDYKVQSSNYTESFQVGYSTTDNNTASFTWDTQVDPTNTSYTEYKATFPAGVKYVAIRYNANNQYYLFIDNFKVCKTPTCITPTGLSVSSITSSQAELSWTSEADNWNVQYKKTGDAEWTDVVGTINTKSYTLSGLLPATNYQARVRTYCSMEDQSDWTEPVAFTTDCATITSFPFAENFNGLVSGIPMCWNNATGTITTESYKWNYYSTGHDGACVRMNSANPDNGQYNVLKTPAMNFPMGKIMQLSFWYKNPNTGDFSVYISNDGGTTYTTALAENLVASEWTLKEIVLPAGFTENVVIAFKGTSNYGYNYIHLDDVTIEEAPACPKPTGLTASNPTWQGATLAWTAGSDETEWKIIYGAAGFDPASEGTTIDGVTTNPYTLTGLSPETEYDVYVKAVKGTDESALSDKATFTTEVKYPAPTGLAISDLTTTSATLTWTAGTDTQWEVAINTTGVTPTEEGTVVNAATYVFSELVTETTYYAFVRSKHDAEYSAWSAACEFTPSAYTYLTVNDGANTDYYTPIVGSFGAAGDAYGQFIIPKANLTDVQNHLIKKLTFYSSNESFNFGNAEFDVYLKEIEADQLSANALEADWNTMTNVYSGTLSISDYKMTIVFTSDFDYVNKSLLVGIRKTSTDKGASTYVTYKGVNSANYMSYSQYSRTKFQPKTTIGYQEKTGAELKVYDGETELTESPASFDFGFVPAGTTHTFTLKNTAATSYTATVSSANLTVDPTTAITPDADGETFTVTMPNHDINNEAVVITPEDGKGLNAFTINVSGRYRDASKIFVDFTNDDIPTAWTASKWTKSYSGYIYDDGTTAESHAELTTSRIVSTNENLSLSAKLKTDAGILNVWWSADGTEWLDENKTELKTQLNTTEFRSVNVNVPAAAKYVKFEGYNAYIKSIYGLADAPSMKVRKTAEAETFYVVNASAGSLAGVDAALTGTGFTLNKTNLSDDGGNFTIAIDTEVKGYREATVTVSGTNQDDFVINLKGFVSGAAGKMHVDFNDNQLPANWKNADTNPWEFADGKAHTKSSNTANALLTTCKLTVAADEVLAIKAKGENNSSELKVHVYQNGQELTAKKATFDSQVEASTENNTTLYFTGLAVGDYKLVFEGWKVYIDEIAGFTVNPNDPELKVYSDSEATQEVATETTKDFGWVADDADDSAFTSTYYIKNNGTGTLTISNISEVEGFTAATAENATTVSGGNTLALTITMDKNAVGAKSGTFTLTTDGGNFTIPVKGFVCDHSKNLVDFTANGAKFPAGWTAGSWTITDGAAISTSSSTIQTKKFTVAANENLYVDIKGNNGNGTKTFAYSYSTDNGANWSEANTLISETGYGKVDDQILTISDIASTTEERTVLVRITGQNLGIKHIYGFTRVDEAVMTTTAVAHDFGMQASDVEPATNAYVFTVSNEGNIDLTNLAVTLGNGNESAFTVAVAGSKTTLAAGESAEVTVTMKSSTVYGAKNDNLTIAAEGQTPVVIALTGKTRDVAKQYVEFATEIPNGWTSNGWSVTSGEAKATNGTLRTTPLTIAANETMAVDARISNSNSGSLKVRYTTNNGVDWQETTIPAVYNYNTCSTYTFNLGNTENAVTAFFEFVGENAVIDNFYGGVAATAPLLEVTENTSAVANNANFDFGSNLQAEPAAKVFTLANKGNASMDVTIAKTGDVTVSPAAATIAAGEPAEVTVSLPYDQANVGDKTGTVTITLGTVVFTLNFTGNTIDPTALNEELTSLPAGWYKDNAGWIVDGSAHIYYGVEKELITEQYGAEAGKNVLSFKAKAQSGNEGTLKVYTSTDRKTWSEPTEFALTNEYATKSLAALADGNYYVKFVSSNANIDDLTGLKKIIPAPEHDLYVSTSNIPTATKVPETSITATATVYSLRAAETGVYAKLFFDETVVATAAAQDISLNGSKTFELTGNVPATEKTYAAKIVVYYSNDDVAFETATTNVEVQHTRTLAITSFTRTDGDGALDADVNNQVSPAFSVTVENTGTTAGTPTVKIYQGENVVATAAAAAEVAAGDTSDAIALTATNMSAGEGGDMAFTAKAFWTADDLEAKATSASDIVITINAAAPKFALYDSEDAPVANEAAYDYGLTRTKIDKVFTIKNEGTKTLQLTSIVAPTGFTATAVTNENKNIAVNGELAITVSLDPSQGLGKKNGNVVITYDVNGTPATFTLAVSGRSIAENTWVEQFDEGIPATWQNTGWTVENGQAYSGGFNEERTLMTPRLAAAENEELTFDATFRYTGYTLTVEYSTDKTSWNSVATINDENAGEQTFTAPAAGNYYLRFTGTRYAQLDNFIGFTLNIPEHDMELTASDVPTTGTQYGDYVATVTLKENAGKDENITAELWVNNAKVNAAVDVTSVGKNSTQVVTLTWEPQDVINAAVQAYVKVTYAGGELQTVPVNLTVAAPYTLNEESTDDITSGEYQAVVVKHSFAKDWNTICLPFGTTTAQLTEQLGVTVKAYALSSYTGNLNFTEVTELAKGNPYLIHVALDANTTGTVDLKFKSVNIESAFANSPNTVAGKFVGTYKPVAANGLEGKYGVTPTNKIAKGNANTTMKGFRAYFEGISANARISIYDEATGISKVYAPADLFGDNDRVYNLSGQKVENAKKGVYIVNGRKVVVK